jgi:hypothetical protein
MIMDHCCQPGAHRIVGLFWKISWVFLAVLLVALVAEYHGAGTPVVHGVDLALLLLPWITGLLLLAIGRAGPLKNWAVPWLISLSFPVIILSYGVHLARMWSSIASASTPAVVAFCIVLPVAWYLRFFVGMHPRRCPRCRLASLIPLLKLEKQDPRSSNTWWCAGCDGKYWKDRHGVWQKERRLTWLDRQQDREELLTAAQHQIPVPARTPSVAVAPASSTSGT